VGGGEAERDDWVPMMIVAAADGVLDLQQKARANCGATMALAQVASSRIPVHILQSCHHVMILERCQCTMTYGSLSA
jgi:hypothetical protein